MTTLTLSSTGPSPDPVTVPRGDRSLTITNDLGSAVVFTLSPAGFLNPSNGATLNVPVGNTDVTVGAQGGTYSYVDPTSSKKATRSGRIDVS